MGEGGEGGGSGVGMSRIRELLHEGFTLLAPAIAVGAWVFGMMYTFQPKLKETAVTRIEEKPAINYPQKIDYPNGLEMARSWGYFGELPEGRTEFELRNNNSKRTLCAYVTQITENKEGLGWTAIVQIPESGLENVTLQK